MSYRMRTQYAIDHFLKKAILMSAKIPMNCRNRTESKVFCYPSLLLTTVTA